MSGLSQSVIKKAEKLQVEQKSVNFSNTVFTYGIVGKKYDIILDLNQGSLTCNCQGFKCRSFNPNIAKLGKKQNDPDCKHCYAVRIFKGLEL